MSVVLRLLEDKDSKGRNLWKLEEQYVYRIGPWCKVKVPAGYVTNFGTVPRCCYRIITPAELREASLVHDYMCNEKFLDDGTEINSGFTRWMADAVLFEAMEKVGIGPFRRRLVYLAVRLYANLKGLL